MSGNASGVSSCSLVAEPELLEGAAVDAGQLAAVGPGRAVATLLPPVDRRSGDAHELGNVALR